MNKQEIKNSIILVTYWGTNVCISAFTTGYLTRCEYSNLKIGLIMTFGAIFTVILDSIFDNGYLKSKHLKKSIIFIYLFSLFLAALFIKRAKPDYLNMSIFALIYSLITYNQSLINILCERQKHKYVLTDGKRPANIGLLGYGFITLTLGFIISQTTPLIILNVFIVFSIVSIILVLFLTKEEKVEYERKKKYHLKDAFVLLHKNKIFTLYLIASSLSAIGSMAALKYLVRVVNLLGGNALNHAIALTIQTLIILPVSKKSSKIIESFSVETLLTISFFFSFLKIFLLFVAGDLWVVYLSMACSVFGYGLFGFSNAKFAREINSDENASLAHKLSMLVSSFGIGPFIGGIIGGLLMEYGDLKLMLFVSSLLTFISFVVEVLIVILRLRLKKDA